jgi:hypothetical protein
MAKKRKRDAPIATLEGDGFSFHPGLLSKGATAALLQALSNAANKKGLLCDQFDRTPVKEWRTAPKLKACDKLCKKPAVAEAVARIRDALGEGWRGCCVASVGLLQTPPRTKTGVVHSDLAAAAEGAGLTVIVGLVDGAAGTEVLSTTVVKASKEVAEDFGTGDATAAFDAGKGATFGYDQGDVLVMGQHSFHRATSTMKRKGMKFLCYLVLVRSPTGLDEALRLDTEHNYPSAVDDEDDGGG